MTSSKDFEWQTVIEQTQKLVINLSEDIDVFTINSALAYVALRGNLQFSEGDYYSIAAVLQVMAKAIDHHDKCVRNKASNDLNAGSLEAQGSEH